MAYTVKQLSELSGVTVRTLHFYEEIELLKPAYYGSNGFRYYEGQELLLLQQILFFKELGFTLKQIRKVMGRGDFDTLGALLTHRQTLTREMEKMGQLIKTIDKTIKHLKGQKKMKDKEMFNGFNEWAKGKGSESYFIGHCTDPDKCDTIAETIVLKSAKKTNNENLGKSYWENIEKVTTGLLTKISQCIDDGLKPNSDEVQSLIKQHHAFAKQFHHATKEMYKALAQLYRNHPVYRKQLDPFHPQLAEFMSEAMEIFAEREL